MKQTDPPIIVEATFDTSKEKLWQAITELDQMTKWFFDNIPAFQPEVGFETSFAVKNETRTFTHRWKIVEVIPLQIITYNWRYDEYPGDSFVSFELYQTGDQVMLRVICEVTKDFPEDVPEFTRKSCIGGWEYFIGDRLKVFLIENSSQAKHIQ